MKIKKRVGLLFSGIVICSMITVNAEDAKGNRTKLDLNGKSVELEAYNIGGNNFFKLRDLATIFNDTDKKFNVEWNKNANSIEIVGGKNYDKQGNELVIGKNLGKENANKTNSKVIYNGKELNLVAYNIKGNNYFKLRDIAEKLNVFTGYNSNTKTIALDTNKAYVKEVVKPVSNSGLETIKKNIEAGKYGQDIPKKVVDIIYTDFKYNKKPHVVAVAVDGKENGVKKIVHIDNNGKFINAQKIYIEDTAKVKLYNVDDTMRLENDTNAATKHVVLVEEVLEEGREGLELSGFEYYKNKLMKYKYQEGTPISIQAVDGYKLKLFVGEDAFILMDLSDNEDYKNNYYHDGGKAKTLEEANGDGPNYGNSNFGNIRTEIVGVEQYVDNKTGYEGLKMKCKVYDSGTEYIYGYTEVIEVLRDLGDEWNRGEIKLIK